MEELLADDEKSGVLKIWWRREQFDVEDDMCADLLRKKNEIWPNWEREKKSIEERLPELKGMKEKLRETYKRVWVKNEKKTKERGSATEKREGFVNT